MPVIHEDDEINGAPYVDFVDLLDIPESALDTSRDILGGSTVAGGLDGIEYAFLLQPILGSYHTTDISLSFLANDDLGQWNISEPINEPYAGTEEPDYAKFENV